MSDGIGIAVVFRTGILIWSWGYPRDLQFGIYSDIKVRDKFIDLLLNARNNLPVMEAVYNFLQFFSKL